MGVIDLKKYSGLALSFDGTTLIGEEGSIDVGYKETVKIDDMRPQLLNPDLTCPVIFYTVYKGVDRKSLLKRKNLRFDTYIIPQNLAGIEYVKTKGMRVGSCPLLIEVIHGHITVILQTSDYEPEEGIQTYIVKLAKGEKYIIPPGFDFIFVNTRQSTAIIAGISSTKGRIMSVFDDTRGAACYMIRKNARQEIVQNPFYRKITRKKPCRPVSLYKYFGLTEKTPIFKQILRKYDRFRWLHDSDMIEWDNVPYCT
jgi:oxalate decarboxylase/phosphoglucose isomerase-like protein (cupin superfamily)